MLLRVKRGAIRSVLPWRPTLTKSVVGRNAALKINSVDFTAQRALYTSRYLLAKDDNEPKDDKELKESHAEKEKDKETEVKPTEKKRRRAREKSIVPGRVVYVSVPVVVPVPTPAQDAANDAAQAETEQLPAPESLWLYIHPQQELLYKGKSVRLTLPISEATKRFVSKTRHLAVTFAKSANDADDARNEREDVTEEPQQGDATPAETPVTGSADSNPSDSVAHRGKEDKDIDESDREPLPRIHEKGWIATVSWHSSVQPGCVDANISLDRRIVITKTRPFPNGNMQVSYMFLEEPEYTQEVKESLKVWIIQLQASIRSATELRRDWNLREEARKFTIDIYDMDPVEAIEKAPKFLDHMPDLINYQAYVDADTIQQRAQVLIQFFHIQLRLFRKRLEIMGSAGSASGAQSTEKEVWKSMLQENQEDASADKDKKKQVEKFRARLEGKSVPENVMAVIEENFTRMLYHENFNAEYGLTLQYLEWLTNMPWGIYTKDSYDIEAAQKILDEDHFGMKDVKDRILEFIAVASISGKIQGKILCFVGPPGTGKTSIAKSIAAALGRKYVRLSIGGMTEAHEIKGHRRTYVGAMPGQVIKQLKQCGTQNPLILLDEVDKASTIRGDATTALLEVLDPSQNNNFNDVFMDIPVDLSKCLFICTANRLSPIPAPLLDRMEVIRLDGYVEEEKYQIAKKYLVPQSIEKTNLTENELSISDAALENIVRAYCREPGVRDLKAMIEKVFEKASLKIARGEATSVKVSRSNIVSFLGPPVYKNGEAHAHLETPPGMCYSLLDRETLPVECSIHSAVSKKSMPEREEMLRTTGRIDEVMKEAASIALTYAKNFLFVLDPSNRFFEDWSIHMHMPQGSQEKGGTSAGAAMVTALLSLAMKRPINNDLVIGGEVTLTGKILPINNVKASVIASRYHEAKHLVLPIANKPEWEELDNVLHHNLTVHFVETYPEVFEIAFAEKQQVVSRDSVETISATDSV